jgi:hypothetical protein
VERNATDRVRPPVSPHGALAPGAPTKAAPAAVTAAAARVSTPPGATRRHMHLRATGRRAPERVSGLS